MNFGLDKSIFIQLREVFSFMPTFKEMLNLFQRVRQISGMLNRYGPGRLEEVTRPLLLNTVNEESLFSVKHHSIKEYA
jgi:hypothetical protein